MNAEELKQEAEEWLNKWELCNKCKNKVDCISNFSYCKKVVLQSYLASAEPREKQITGLSKHILELQKDKGNLIDRCRELEQQIEKMKCCANCEHYDCLCDCFNEVEQYCDKWEIKEK